MGILDDMVEKMGIKPGEYIDQLKKTTKKIEELTEAIEELTRQVKKLNKTLKRKDDED